MADVATTKLVVAVACAFSAIAFVTCMAVIPSLYQTINEIHDEVQDGIQVFRIETDVAWSELMGIQLALSRQSKPRENPLDSIFRQKRRSKPGFPAWCMCEPSKPICPPGPPGPPGRPGADGVSWSSATFKRGKRGSKGKDGSAWPSCAPAKCFKCPAGKPGRHGPPGRRGLPGEKGLAGAPGIESSPGPPGKVGARGDVGPPGKTGKAGVPGSAGRCATRVIYKPGPKGLPGRPGVTGASGAWGKPGLNGPMGAPGPQGPQGPPGPRGMRGMPGNCGVLGAPGLDGAYCPCPVHSSNYILKY